MRKKMIAALIAISIIMLCYSKGSNAETLNPVSLSITPSCALAGSPITIIANGNKSSGVYYKYWARATISEEEPWIVLQDWATNNTCVWTSVSDGRKLVAVWLAEDTSDQPPITTIILSYEVGSSNCIDPIGISLRPTSGRVNEPVTITVTGAQDGLFYQFWVTPGYGTPFSGNRQLLKDWSTDNTCTWTPRSQDWYVFEVYTADDIGSPITGDAIITYKVDLPSETGSLPLVSSPAATPEVVRNDGGSSSLLTVNVTDPDNDLVSVVIDLSPLGGSSSQAMYDDGTNGDVTAGDGIYSIQATVSSSASVGQKALRVTATDQAGNTASNFIDLSITQEIRDSVQPQSTKIYAFQNDVPGQRITITYFLSGASAHYIMQTESCNPTITVKKPDGEVYTTETVSTTQNTITIPNADPGTWTYEVNNNCETPRTHQINISAGGTGVIVGTVVETTTQTNLAGVNITTDIGGVALTVDGYYVLVSAAGTCTVTASSLSYRVESETNVVLNPGEAVTVDFALTAVPVNTNEITVNLTSPASLGNPVNISFEATGPAAPLYYKFWQASGYQTPGYGHWQVLQDWSTAKLLSWLPNSDDHYVIVAYITDNIAGGGYHQAGLSLETVGNRANPILIKKLTTNLSYPQSKGTTINLDTTATGGDGPLLYRYWQKREPGGTWSMIRDYSGVSSCSWIPPESGVYIIVVWVTDDTSVSDPPIAGMTCTIGE